MRFSFSKNLFFHLLLSLIFTFNSSILLATEEIEVLKILSKYKQMGVGQNNVELQLDENDCKLLLSIHKVDFDWESKGVDDYEMDHLDIALFFNNVRLYVPNAPMYFMKSLNLASNNLSDKGTMLLFQNMILLPNLERLNIGKNKIKDISIQSIAGFLKGNPPLAHLNLEDNNSLCNLESLAKALVGNTRLKTLGLTSLKLQTTSTKELAKIFPANMTLQSFIWDQSQAVVWDKSHPIPRCWYKKSGKDVSTSIISQVNLNKIVQALKENKEDKSLRRLSISDLVVVEANINSKGFNEVKHEKLNNLKYKVGDFEFFKASQIGAPLDYEESILAIDPSGEGSDETAYAVVRKLNNNFYVTAVSGIDGDGSQTTVLQQLADLAHINKVGLILVEKNYYQGLYENFLTYILQIKNINNIKVKSVQNTGIKSQRIMRILYPVINTHRLIVSSIVIDDDLNSQLTPVDYSLFNQLRRISYQAINSNHDDRLDALAMAVEFLSQ